jgi:YbgC/YbaW family acyl-CoA thioester hydrolase
VNYPSNPTAETVDLAFYERLVAWAKENKVWILSDLAYSELYFDGNPTPSILQVKGGKDVAVEFTSLSKTYSMAGWRVGFAVGNRQLIAAMTRVKSYLDYGAFTPIQAAACAALNGPQDIVEQNRQLYHKRRDILVEAFGRAGWDIPPPRASMFAWAPLPPALAHLGSLEFSKQMLTHAKVAVAPGVGYGEDGEGFVRIAMVENEHRLRQAARNVKRYLSRWASTRRASPRPSRMPRSDFAFHHRVRVRWSETDAQGVVFNARYLDYADVAITEYWREAKLRERAGEEPLEFHVKKATVTWFAPILPDELIDLMARTIATGRTSVTQTVEIHGARDDGSDDLRATVELVSVFVDLATHRPQPLPEWVGAAFTAFDAGAEGATLVSENA